jgi:zinc/manganese transport system substrate-binding protein
VRNLCYVITLLAFGSGPAGAEPPSRLPVVASFSILADLVREIGGERVGIRALVGPDGDAHAYQPTPADAKVLAEARLVVVNGLGFEGWIERCIKSSKTTAPVVVASSGVPLRLDEEGGHGIDPHAWQSIGNVRLYVGNIRDGLIAADSEGAETYRANAKAYLDKLAALEAEVVEKIAKITPSRRKIITTHDAFGYFGAAYGFEFIAPEGVATEAEPSARDIAKIIRQIKAQKIPAVFMENIIDARTMTRIAAETGAQVGGILFSDALSGPSGPAPTYVDMMRHNVSELANALGR